MKLIIDIPNDYKDLLPNIQNGSIACKVVLDAVKNGTPYEERPKGIYKPKSCSKCKYHYDYSIEDEPCKSCIAYSNYEDMRGDL